MNVLPTGPFHLGEDLEQYFNHMDQFHFDVAYIAYYAYGWSRTTKEYRNAYIAFADEAHKRGMKACVQIQTVLALEEDVPLTEAQYFSNGDPVLLGPGVFMASYASDKWRDYLKKLGRLFIEYGYDWIVHEEPCWPVDVPGEQDLVYKRFREKFPEMEYPYNREETTLNAEQFRNNLSLLDRREISRLRGNHQLLMHTAEYEQVQRFKMDVLVAYFEDIAKDAKAAGAEKFGIMPWIFTPTSENTPAVTMNSCNHLGRIGMIEELDLLIVRMQPDNIYYHDDPFNGLIDELGEAEPKLYYLETMAHQMSKQVITVNNPVNERNFLVSRSGEHSVPLPLDFYKRCTLAALAGNPNGLTRHWYDQAHFNPADQAETSYNHNTFLSRHLPWLTRLGSPVADLAFVFSFEAAAKAQPWGRAESWRAYYRFASEIMYREHLPMKTLHTGVLRRNLLVHPELKLIVLSDQHPLEEGDEDTLRHWWQERQGRSLICFGSPGAWHEAGGGSDTVTIEMIGGAPVMITENAFGNKRYVFDMDLRYAPLEQVCAIVRAALDPLGQRIGLTSASQEVLWSANRAGYIAVSNTGPASVAVQLKAPAHTKLFNVTLGRLEDRDPGSIWMAPYEFSLWKLMEPECPWLDIQGQVSIVEVECDRLHKSAAIRVETRRSPVEIFVETLPLTISLNGTVVKPEPTQTADSIYRLRIEAGLDADLLIGLQW